jgi:L-ascorbate metabolism protein UlaG (beta-lactamase superfamily)
VNPDHLQLNRRTFLTSCLSLILIAKDILAHRENDTPAESMAALRAQRLSWAGVKLELPTITLFIDPLTNSGVWGDAMKDPIIPAISSTKERHVLVTHLHPDHFNIESVKKILADDSNVVCLMDSAAMAASRGVRVRAAKLWEPIFLGDFTVTAVPSVDGYDDPQVAWIVAGGGKKIIHCGDTMFHGGYWKIGRQHGPFDAAFLPINGAKFRWRPPQSEVPAVMTPEQAVAAAVVLGAKLAIPIHYGMSGLEAYEEYSNAESAFIDYAARRKLPIEIVKPGEWVQWKANV